MKRIATDSEPDLGITHALRRKDANGQERMVPVL